ncbi:GNAT family N-acetyltransferase [Paenibacillus albiflavus]|uniref:GNAT family N-acetyltransferase n=1 Tax=Paenibacillus albiflavus TaxID=2545760 RepID=A0A4R4EGX5_9BACL|nr:GNAT family N-acetyltransferase [Paenibacillus albiflavus]TCZ79346.1 GNAT family N-acetyltransferase [Paenibacillus albiflavus]
MIELSFDSFNIAESFFANKKSYIPALSVIYGNYPGRVFVDNDQVPSIAIVWAIGRWMYLEGSLSSQDIELDVSNFLQNVVIPDCRERSTNWFEIYTSDDEQWENLFLTKTHFLEVDKHYESVYTLNLHIFNQVKETKFSVENEIEINNVDFDILPESFHDFSYIRDEFKTKKSSGIEIKKDNQLITICKSNGFIFKNEYFIDVDTFVKEERGKGYATIAAIKLIDSLLANKMYPLWETTHDNIPSNKLALRLGFEVKESYPVYAFEIK